jgi:hypothetical protein
MPKSPPFSPIATVFEREPQIASWTARMRQEARLTALVRRIVPRALAGRVRVALARDGVLELAVPAGAAATVIRQRTPVMTMALRREGWDFTEIRIRVQVGAAERAPVKRPSRQLDTQDAAALWPLADTLADGPLRQSLRRFRRRVQGR